MAMTEKPAAAYALAPSSLTLRTVGSQPYSRASASHKAIAEGQLSRRPIGSPEASDTPAMTR